MKKILISIAMAFIIVVILACSTSSSFVPSTPTALFAEITFPTPTALPADIVQAGGAPPLSGKISIISQTGSSKPADINAFLTNNILSDPDALGVIDWAKKNGYYQQSYLPKGVITTNFSNHLTVHGINFQGTPGQKIELLRFVTAEGKSVSMLGRMEGDKNNPVLVLFNRDGQVRITNDGVKIDTAATNGELLPVSYLIQNNEQENSCTSSFSEVWKKCIKNNSSAVAVFAGGCAATVAGAMAAWKAEAAVAISVPPAAPEALAAAAFTTQATLIGGILTCGPAIMGCVYAAFKDYPPELNIKKAKLEDRFYDTCVGPPGGKTANYLHMNAYAVHVDVSDDREEPPRPEFIDDIVPAASGPTYSATDCSGQTTSKQVQIPLSDINQEMVCPVNTVCENVAKGVIACKPAAATPDPQPPANVQPSPAAPPVPAGLKTRTYKGKWCAEWKSRPGSGTSAMDCIPMDAIFTFQFNDDDTAVLIKAICKDCNPDVHRVYKLVTSGPDVGSYYWKYTIPTGTYAGSYDEERIRVMGGGLICIQNMFRTWAENKSGDHGHAENEFVEVNP
jgi:hypothetical protein